MTFYNFATDVYLVKGKKNACIYDLVKKSLYSLNQQTTKLVESIITEDIEFVSDSDAKNVIDFLLNEQLIVPSDVKQPIIDILSIKKQPAPQFAWIEVTRTCNLSCSFCYEESSPTCTEKMTMDDFKHVIANLKDVGVQRIQFIGGEPTVLKQQLKQMIEYCRKDFKSVEVYSNGILINEEWAKFFKQHNVSVALSIHSYNPKEHDRLTTSKGSHKKVLRALEWLKKYKVRYRIGTVSNAKVDIGKPTKDDKYTLKPKEPKLVGRADMDQYNLDMFLKKAITLKKKKYPITKQMVVTAVSGHQCFIKDLYISTQLEVYPCVMERRLSHGNLKNNKLADILNDKIRFLSKDNIDGCRDCEYRYACFDCRPDSNGRGEFEKPWYCTYNPEEGVWYDPLEYYSMLQPKSRLKSIPIVVETQEAQFV